MEPVSFVVKVEDVWKRIQEQILGGASKFVMEQVSSSSWKLTVYFGGYDVSLGQASFIAPNEDRKWHCLSQE